MFYVTKTLKSISNTHKYNPYLNGLVIVSFSETDSSTQNIGINVDGKLAIGSKDSTVSISKLNCNLLAALSGDPVICEK